MLLGKEFDSESENKIKKQTKKKQIISQKAHLDTKAPRLEGTPPTV